jgi:hypothetical protein
MSEAATTVERWKALNSRRLLECRWGCAITEDACRSYQAKNQRRVIHFNGSMDACSRVNADYIRCLLPDPCPHLLSDDEIDKIRSQVALHSGDNALERRAALRHAREMERLADPNQMLNEAQWHRSLVR